MSKAKWIFKLTDVQRAIKAVRGEGLPISGVRISSDGQIIVDTRPPESRQAPEGELVVL